MSFQWCSEACACLPPRRLRVRFPLQMGFLQDNLSEISYWDCE